MGEEYQAAEAAEAAATAVAKSRPSGSSRLPAATPVQQGGSTGSSSAPPPPPAANEENEVDEELQEAIRLSLRPLRPTTAPTTSAPSQPGTANPPAGGSSWFLFS